MNKRNPKPTNQTNPNKTPQNKQKEPKQNTKQNKKTQKKPQQFGILIWDIICLPHVSIRLYRPNAIHHQRVLLVIMRMVSFFFLR